MPKFLVERNVPGLGQMTAEQLEGLSAQSNAVNSQLGNGIQWVHSYVTDDKLFCVYNAKDEAIIKEHASCGGFPCDRIYSVGAIIDPVTGGA